MTRLLCCIALLAGASPAWAAGDRIDALRGDYALTEEPPAPRLAEDQNEDIRRARNYPMQPPTIPHTIDRYQVDLNANRCMSCHSRHRVEESQAPMISVTHYMDRDGNFLAEVSPRRYFCNQCHVPQTDARPLVENTFQDIDDLLRQARQNRQPEVPE